MINRGRKVGGRSQSRIVGCCHKRLSPEALAQARAAKQREYFAAVARYEQAAMEALEQAMA